MDDGDKQALSQAALELLKQLARMQEHAKVQSQSPAEGLAPLPLQPPHLQELLADLAGKALLDASSALICLARCCAVKTTLRDSEAAQKREARQQD